MARKSKDKDKLFREWLAARGCEILTLTNDWEVHRFRAGDEIGIIYQDKRGARTYQGCAGKAWAAFEQREDWCPIKRHERKRRLPIIIRTIIERDGRGCFFCPKELADEEITVEHLVPLSQGGNNHLSNLAIACDPCNKEAGHLSVAEKVRIRESKRNAPPAGSNAPLAEGDDEIVNRAVDIYYCKYFRGKSPHESMRAVLLGINHFKGGQ